MLTLGTRFILGKLRKLTYNAFNLFIIIVEFISYNSSKCDNFRNNFQRDVRVKKMINFPTVTFFPMETKRIAIASRRFSVQD